MSWVFARPASCAQLDTWANQLPDYIYAPGSIDGMIAQIQKYGFTTEQVTAAVQGLGAFYASADHNANCGTDAGSLPAAPGTFRRQNASPNPFFADWSPGMSTTGAALRGYLILGILTYLNSLDITPRMQAMNVLFGEADSGLGGLAYVITGEAQVALASQGDDATNAWSNVASWLSIAALAQPTNDLLTIVINFAAGTAMTNGTTAPTTVQAAALRVLAGIMTDDAPTNTLLQQVLDAVSTSRDTGVQSAAALLRSAIFTRLANNAGGTHPPVPSAATTSYWRYVWIVGGALLIGAAALGGTYWLRMRKPVEV